jgi:hypothetical protein
MPNKTISKTIFIAFRNYINHQLTKSKMEESVVEKNSQFNLDIGM